MAGFIAVGAGDAGLIDGRGELPATILGDVTQFWLVVSNDRVVTGVVRTVATTADRLQLFHWLTGILETLLIFLCATWVLACKFGPLRFRTKEEADGIGAAGFSLQIDVGKSGWHLLLLVNVS